MQTKRTTIYAHGNKLIVIPYCRQEGTPFSVYESVEVLTAGISANSFGRIVLDSLEKGRNDVVSNSEGFDLDELAKMFGERSIGAFERRSGRISVSISAEDSKIRLFPWQRKGKQGWGSVPGIESALETDVIPEELANLCREYLAISADRSHD